MENKEKNNSIGDATTRAKASTESILGDGRGKPKVASKWAKQFEDLTRLREQLLAKKEALSQAANVNTENPLLGEHLADAATDSYDRDWALSMLSSKQNALYEIDEALDRIARGSYGLCEITREPIEPGRLQAIPWTRFCAATQKDLEAKGAVGRTQLAQLGSFYSTEEPDQPLEDEAELAPAGAREK
jgi:DnaK suppressor protein